MSFSSEDAFDQDDVAKVLEMAREPSYISEIARKLERFDGQWNLTGTGSVEKVAIIVSMLDERGDVDLMNVGYDGETDAQEDASPMPSLTEGVTGEDQDTWNEYTLVHYTDDVEVRDTFKDAIDTTVTVEDKVQIIKNLSGSGNRVSMQAEEIMQDVMERQFRFYEETQTPEYNDPGLDFYVNDEDQRDWGLAVEVSVRWVNQIGSRYLEDKKEKAFDLDADLLILAPRFTQELLKEYEDPSDQDRHADPLDQMVHLHTVPTMKPDVYQPFAVDPEKVHERDPGGNPVIVPDDGQARERLKNRGNVGGGYPVVDEEYSDFIQNMDDVFREYTVIRESDYRHEMREALEPLLWEFLRPYKVEQFLQDMYWDKDLNQSDIGGLIDRSGSTIGEWMRRWGVIRRGTGSPELSDETIEIWKRMYRGDDPFPKQFSGYRIQAEYNRHPLWGLDEWREWYENTEEDERQDVIKKQSSHTDMVGYTLLYNPQDRLFPSYTFIRTTLQDEGVKLRQPDEAPRVPYNAYPSKSALGYMLNKNQDTIVEVGNNGGQ